MSMILDALQRADRERRQQEPAVPSLNDTPAPPPKRRRNRWWILGGSALVMAVGLVAFILTRPAPEPESVEVGTRPRIEPPAETPRSHTEPKSATPEDTAPEPTETPDIARLYQSPTQTDASVAELYRDTEKQTAESPASEPRQEERLATEREPTAVDTTPTTADTTATEAASAPDGSPEANSEPQPQNEPAETAATSNNAEDAGTDDDPVAPEEPAIASIRDLPWNLQQSLPSLNYQSHDYREGDTGQVVINGKKLRGGDRIAPELVLQRIDRDGVVLRYQGYEFKLNALSSWVNM